VRPNLDGFGLNF